MATNDSLSPEQITERVRERYAAAALRVHGGGLGSSKSGAHHRQCQRNHAGECD